MTTQERNPQYLTVQQFAERAGMHTNTVYRAIQDERIPYKVVRKGFDRRYYLIPVSALPVDAKTAA